MRAAEEAARAAEMRAREAELRAMLEASARERDAAMMAQQQEIAQMAAAQQQAAVQHTDTDRYDQCFQPRRQQLLRAGTETHQVAVAGDRAFREQAEHFTGGQPGVDLFDETAHFLGMAGVRNRQNAQIPEQQMHRQKVVDFLAYHKSDPSMVDRLDEQQVDQGNVVRNQQHRTGIGDVFQPRYGDPDHGMPHDECRKFDEGLRKRQPVEQNQNEGGAADDRQIQQKQIAIHVYIPFGFG